jgi:ribonuclease HI
MSIPAPHFLLHAQAACSPAADGAGAACWQFVLRSATGETALEAADEEPQAGPERLELLAVVRGLEALDQPSRVTLLAGSRSLRRGLQCGISQWRESDWQWERYGRMTPVKNGDLWRRLDRLLEIHSVDCAAAPPSPSDDLAAPAIRSTGGRHWRVDQPSASRAMRQSTKTIPPRRAGRKFRASHDNASCQGPWLASLWREIGSLLHRVMYGEQSPFRIPSFRTPRS